MPLPRGGRGPCTIFSIPPPGPQGTAMLKHALIITALLAGSPLPAPLLSPVAAAGPVTTIDNPMDSAIKSANDAVAAIVKVPDKDRNFDNTVGAIDDLLATFEQQVSLFIFMSNVHPDASVRESAQAAEEKYNNFLIELSKREDLFKAVKTFAATNPKLEGEQKRLLAFTLRDYHRAGMDLTPEKRAKLSDVQKEIGKLVIEFNKNTAEDASVVMATEDELKGVPAELIKSLPGNGGVHAVGLSYPIYTPVMENCENESTRQKMWMAYKRRGGKKNIAVLEKVLALRGQEASLLGYKNNAEYEIEVRMAKTPKAVEEFYAKLRPLAREKAKQDFVEFEAAKRTQTHDPKAELKPWDFKFWS